MAPTKTGKAAPVAKPKKEKINHPASRKAGQLARNSLRKGKLGNLASKSRQKQHSLVDVYGFFYHAMPEDGSVLTLEALHSLVKDIWLTRHDLELEEERAARRKGRPKSVKEAKLEDINAREMDEYRTGMEVPDLTHSKNVELFHRWDQKEVAFIQQLRFIRIFRDEPEVIVVSRPGKHQTLLDAAKAAEEEKAMQMDLDDEAPTLLDSR